MRSPTAYSSGLQPIASNDLNGNRQVHRRISRTDLDFEQALKAEGTVVLREGVDVNSLGVDASPANVKSSATNTPVARTISRVALQPPTPIVVPPTPSPAPGPPTRSATTNAVPPAVGSSSQSSSSHNDLFNNTEDAERQTNRRSMYRSPGTSSSPDLATLLRKAKERGGPVVVGGTGHHKRRESPPPPLPDAPTQQSGSSNSYLSSTLVASPSPSQSRSVAGGHGTDRTVSSLRPKENGTIKLPKSSVRAKTSALWGKMTGQSTIRERSKTDASLHPTSAHYPPSSLMDAFTPPTPPLPLPSAPLLPLPAAERHAPPPMLAPVADVFSNTITTARAEPNKPLPPGPVPEHSEEVEDRSPVIIKKIRALPAIPISPNVTKRRSMGVSDTGDKLTESPTSAAAADHMPKENAAEWEDGSLHGLLDVFKGELSTLDPVSPASLDLRDPSTPARQLSYRLQADGLVLSVRETQVGGGGSERDEGTKSPPTLSPAAVSRRIEQEDKAAPVAIIPPRSSSLQSPVYPIGSGSSHATSLRQANYTLTPLRSRSGPSMVAAAASPSKHLRVLHHSTASSSEPSLIPAPDEGRVFLSPQAISQQDLMSSDSTRLSSPSTPIINGEDLGDMETRGKEMAARCWNENEEFLAKEKIAEWLGGHAQINKVALRHYVDFFDFTGLRLDLAFRRLCAKLYLKGETQQVDRILEQFSRRYWDCNPGGLYGSANIVHAVSYSLLLLNTDLHVAELTTRMSRNQFVRNTLTAIQMQLQPTSAATLSSSDLTYDDCSSSVRGSGTDETEVMSRSRSKRSDSITSWNSLSREAVMSLPIGIKSNQSGSFGAQLPNGSSPSVQVSTDHAHGRAWENDMESLLKEIYNAIKNQQILQPINSSVTRSSVSSLSPGGGMMRNRSLRAQPDRLTTLKRGSIRGLQSILSIQSGASPYSSNSSIDGRVSPSPSFATSTHEAMYGSSSSFLNPTLGFASNLSHTIIREAQEDDDRSVRSEGSASTTISISDEELALLGAPWAKEGMLCRKQYWESVGKRARDKAWLDVFVVIQRGELNMFTFGDNTSGSSGTFGGGNWLANARPVGTIHLSHSLAHALPPPGYNKRPHCMVLTLANRGVYFFQAGTEELVNEWVSTCNYWAARTSKEPLAGGVSNMEYGWNKVMDIYGHGRSHSSNDLPGEPDIPDTISVRSGKSTRSKYGWRDAAATVRGPYSPRGEKTFINDWKPPLPPTMASVHDEETQLDALRKHVASLKKDLETHNELRERMSLLYQPRSAQAMKAQSNWEEKSQYLLREIVKYDLYIDSLLIAMTLRLKKRGEKALERALSSSGTDDEGTSSSAKKWLNPEQDGLSEEEAEPIVTVSRRSHRM
ncbi:hypothetical protein BYT27DRAFT_7177517 [Phlegmacium glaucopus]|nr:hypothetical protein BYT27DRAFT_7177517 [Phlegmacium glaucopus]